MKWTFWKRDAKEQFLEVLEIEGGRRDLYKAVEHLDKILSKVERQLNEAERNTRRS